MSVYLYDLEGDPIAFRRTWTDPYLFGLDGSWIGHCPWGDNDVVDRSGRYLGSVVNDRLVRRNDWCERTCHQMPDAPTRTDPTGAPRGPLHFPNAFAYEDVGLRTFG